MNRILASFICGSLVSACTVGDDSGTGDTGQNIGPGMDVPDLGPSEVYPCTDAEEGQQLAWDWWSGQCACGGTSVCRGGEWVDQGGSCGGSCSGMDPDEAQAIDWETYGDAGPDADMGSDMGGGGPYVAPDCEGVPCEDVPCEDVLDRIAELAETGVSCNDSDGCLAVDGFQGCDCLPNLYPDGLAVNPETQYVLAPYVQRAYSDACVELLPRVCDAGSVRTVGCVDGLCAVTQHTCGVP